MILNNDSKAKPKNSKGTILVVDDTPANLDLVFKILTTEGYHVMAVPDGARALLTVQKVEPDLILLDINMPNMNGYEVCERLKAAESTKKIPVIFISVLTETFDKVKAFCTGGVDYITKPFQTEEMVARIETHLSIYRLQGQLKEANTQLRQEIVKKEAAEQATKLAQAELLKRARQAGMAEIAIGVLHNIGNGLTPLITNLYILKKTLQESPMRTQLDVIMKKTFAPLYTISDLPEADRIRMIKVTKLLPESIRNEYDDALNRLETISENEHHIEKMVNLHMQYAQFKDQHEVVNINRLIQDTLNMIADPLLKYGVRLVTSFAALPSMLADKTQLMQVFLNIIKNAYEAMENTPPENRQINLTTEIEAGQPDHLVFTVQDTGIGFAPEKETDLFGCGYSTKNRGSGFGLHSCGNYIISQNGTIQALSAGNGKGARFVIRLPITAPQATQPHSVTAFDSTKIPLPNHSNL